MFAATMTFAASGAIVLVLWEGGREVISGAMTTGTQSEHATPNSLLVSQLIVPPSVAQVP